MEQAYSSKKNKLIFLAGAILLILILAIVFLVLNNKKVKEGNQTLNNGQNNSENVNSSENTPGVQSDGLTVYVPENAPAAVKDALKDATIKVSGASIVTKDDKVVNNKGVEVKNDAKPMTEDAPRLSRPIKESELSSSDIKLKATTAGFSPKEFKVKSGSVVTIALTSEGTDSRLVFDDKNLVALELPVPLGYTMAKTFKAPVPGTYAFRQDIPGRLSEEGKMIVE